MINAILIDDEKEALRNLRQLLNHHCPSIQVLGEAGGVVEGIRLINQHQPEVVFLDIQMDDGTGFDLLSCFKEPSFQVIFVTAYDQFAIKAFEFSAVDYLLKPIDISRLKLAVKKAEAEADKEQYFKKLTHLMDSIQHQRHEMIILQTREGQHYIQLENIIRLEADKNYTSFFCKDRKQIVVSETLKKYENLLSPNEFFRTHQSHIIHRPYVKSYIKEDGGFIQMTDGSQVPISRRKKDEFFEWVRGSGCSF